MTTKITIADRSQYPQIEALYKKVIHDLDVRINYPQWHWGIHPSEDLIKDAIADKTQFLFWKDDVLTGCAIVNETLEEAQDAVFHHDNFAAIHMLAMDPQVSGQGLADAFLKELMDMKKGEGYHSFRLSLIEGNVPARNLYLRHGFMTAGHSVLDTPHSLLNFELMEKEL